MFVAICYGSLRMLINPLSARPCNQKMKHGLHPGQTPRPEGEGGRAPGAGDMVLSALGGCGVVEGSAWGRLLRANFGSKPV